MNRHVSAALALAVVALAAAPAAAQGDAPPSPAPEAPAQPSATKEEARKHFEAGVALLQDPEGQRVEEAYREFKRAFELSQSPKVLGNMGFCAMKLERDGEAIDAYTRYLREVPDIEEAERAQIVRDLQTLQVGVARVTIKADKPGVQLVDVRVPVKGPRVTNTYGPVDGSTTIGIRPGHHIVTARAQGFEDATWEFDAFAGGTADHAFALAPVKVAPPPPQGGVGPVSPAPEPPPSKTLPWVVTGVGAAMLLTGGVTGALALGKTKDIEKSCPNDLCPAGFDLDGERSSARTLVTLTDVLLIGGAIVTAGGVTWLLLSGSGDKETPARAGRVIPSGGCSALGCSGNLKVTF